MNAEAIINRVTETISTKTVIGDVIEIDGLKLIPIVNVSFGFGGGTGDSKSSNAPGSGSGAGGGARMKVAGVLVVKDGDIKFVQTGKGGALDKLIDAIPDWVDRVKERTESGAADEGESS